jgi:hypothetical protein
MMSGAYEGGLRGSGGSMSVGGSSGDHNCSRRDDAPRSICNTHGSMFIVPYLLHRDFMISRIHEFTISRFHDFTTFARIHDFLTISRLSHDFTAFV